MLKFFIALFILSLAGIAFLHYGVERKKTKRLLHDFQKSCKISSVRFERRCVKLGFYLKSLLLKISRKRKILCRKTRKRVNYRVAQLRYSLRKRLFDEGHNDRVAEHLVSIKENLHK